MNKFPFYFIALSVTAVLITGCGGDDPVETGSDGPGVVADTIPPAAVSDLHTSFPTAGSLALVWTAPGDDGMNGTASEYDVRYSTQAVDAANWESATQFDAEPVPKPAGELETVTITGLGAATDYYFALKSSDEVPNVSPLSNCATGTTAQETNPPGEVSDLVVSAVDDSSYRFDFTAPGDDYLSGTASQYDIRYSTSPITASNWEAAGQAEGEPPPNPLGHHESFVLTGFGPAPKYYFAMKAADEVPNWSGISNVAIELEYGRSLWAWPTTIHYNSEQTVMNVLYRVKAGQTVSLVMDYFPYDIRVGMDDECGTVNPWNDMEPVGSPAGTHFLTFDFAGKVSYGMRQYVILCHDSEFVDEIQISLTP